MDDFRDELFSDDDDEFGFDDFAEDGERPRGQVIGAEDDFSDFDDTGRASGGKFLGMSSMERAFLSVMIFLNVVVLGSGLLLAFGRFGF